MDTVSSAGSFPANVRNPTNPPQMEPALYASTVTDTITDSTVPVTNDMPRKITGKIVAAKCVAIVACSGFPRRIVGDAVGGMHQP